MKSESIFTYILILFVIIVIIKIYLDSEAFNLKCIISEVDGNKYCVSERNKIHLVTNLLARVTNKMKTLTNYMNEKYGEKNNVKRLKENFNPKRINETLPTSKLTAYSENKGEKLAFCVTKQKNGKQLIDENTLTFVALHELAHNMTKSIGHTEEYWDNFKFLLENAVKIGIYNPINYGKTPKQYCGMEINDNPLFS